MPVPRLVLRPERSARRHPARREGRGRPLAARPQAGPRRRLAGLPLRQPDTRNPDPLLATLDSHYDSPLRFEEFGLDVLRTGTGPRPWLLRTGRSSSRTTTSACTARSSTPSSSRPSPRTRWADLRPEPRGRRRGPGHRWQQLLERPAGTTRLLPNMTEEQASSIYGCQVFPTMFLDVAGSNVVATRLVPEGPRRTRVFSEYLFMPEDIASATSTRCQLSTSASWSPTRTTSSASACSAESRHGLHARRLPGEGRLRPPVQPVLPPGDERDLSPRSTAWAPAIRQTPYAAGPIALA